MRQADRRAQLKQQRVLALGEGNGRLKFPDRFVETRRIETKQTFAAQAMKLREINADAGLV